MATTGLFVFVSLIVEVVDIVFVVLFFIVLVVEIAVAIAFFFVVSEVVIVAEFFVVAVEVFLFFVPVVFRFIVRETGIVADPSLLLHSNLAGSVTRCSLLATRIPMRFALARCAAFQKASAVYGAPPDRQ